MTKQRRQERNTFDLGSYQSVGEAKAHTIHICIQHSYHKMWVIRYNWTMVEWHKNL